MRRLAMVLLMGAIILGVLATSADARRGHNNVRHATTTSRSTSTTAAVTTTTTRGTIPVDPTPFLNVLDYGAVGDGVTDDLDAIDTAMSAASAAGKDLYFPPGTYLMSDINGVPSGLTLRGDPEGDSIINGGFYLPDASRLKYLEFVPQFSRAVIIGGAGSLTTGAEVSHCTFTGDFTWTAVHAVRAADCFIMNNTFTGGVDGGNIQFNAGKGNYVTNNSITDGRTGILFLYGRTQGGGGYDGMIWNNVVTGNTVSGVTEEGISFDSWNHADQVPCLEYDTIVAVNGSTITLSSHTWPNYAGYDMCFLDGVLMGRTRNIVSRSGNDFVVSPAPTGAAPGDEIVIGSTFKGNVISGNTVSAGWTDIILYGMCFENIVENNQFSQYIDVRTVDETQDATGSATGTEGRGLVGYNRIIGNTGPYVRCYYYNVGDDSYSDFQVKGNNIIDNILSGGIVCDNNWFYKSGNTGTYTDNGGNTVSETEME